MVSRSFQRTLSSLSSIFAFIDEVLAARHPDAETSLEIHLAVDEIVTNMVTHQPAGAETLEVALECRGGRLIIRLVDNGVEPFDVTAAPDPDFQEEASRRRPGGLGIYLARQVMSAVRYEYDERCRRSELIMEKVLEA